MVNRKKKSIGETIAERIREALADSGLEPLQLADKMETSKSQVYRYLAGDNITIETIERIAAICYKPVPWFFASIAVEETMVAEEGAWYGDPKRRELIAAVKELVRDADDDVITALLHNVKIFRRTVEPAKRKQNP